MIRQRNTSVLHLDALQHPNSKGILFYIWKIVRNKNWEGNKKLTVKYVLSVERFLYKNQIETTMWRINTKIEILTIHLQMKILMIVLLFLWHLFPNLIEMTSQDHQTCLEMLMHLTSNLLQIKQLNYWMFTMQT